MVMPYLVIVASVDVSRHAEVCNFYGKVRGHETISCGQVSVDEVLAAEVRHSRGDFDSHAQESRLKGDHNSIEGKERKHLNN